MRLLWPVPNAGECITVSLYCSSGSASKIIVSGVPRILEGTLPQHLQALSEETDDWSEFGKYLQTKRININVRQVFPKDFEPHWVIYKGGCIVAGSRIDFRMFYLDPTWSITLAGSRIMWIDLYAFFHSKVTWCLVSGNLILSKTTSHPCGISRLGEVDPAPSSFSLHGLSHLHDFETIAQVAINAHEPLIISSWRVLIHTSFRRHMFRSSLMSLQPPKYLANVLSWHFSNASMNSLQTANFISSFMQHSAHIGTYQDSSEWFAGASQTSQ